MITKRALSLLITLLLVITAATAIPLSASAQAADSVDQAETGISEKQILSVAMNETEDAASQPPVEESPQNNYPIITDIQNIGTGTQLTWDTYKDNQIYRVYYRKASYYSGKWDDKYAAGEWTRLATVRGNSYLHTGLSDAEIGIYTIRCVDDHGDFTSDFNPEGWENCYYAEPEFSSIRFDESGVHLTWDPAWKKHGVWNGENYRIYRKTANTGWTRLEQTAEDHYNDTTVEIGVTYYYTLRLIDNESPRFLSDYHSSKAISFDLYPFVNSIKNTGRGAQLSWYRYNGAKAYRVYYRASNGWNRLATVSGTSYTDTSVRNETDRVYTIRALDADENFISDFHHDGWSNTYYTPPVIQTLSNTTQGVKMTWNRAKGAQSYCVYRKTNNGWLRLAKTTASEYTDTTAESGNTYTYTLRMITSNGDDFMSDHTGGKSIFYVAAPAITAVENLSDSVKITWNPVKGANFYRIYYKSANGWTRLASKYLTEYTDTSVKDGETREYTIRCLDENENFVSDFDPIGTGNTFHKPPVIDTIGGSNDGVTLTWKRAKGAEDYRVYRRTSDSSWRLITQTDQSSFTDTTYEKGTLCYYTLRMINSDSSHFMSYHNGGQSILWCATPRFSSITNSEDGTILSWEPVNGAYEYRVYYRSGNEWIRLTSTQGTTYTDSNVINAQAKTYTIRCVDKNGAFISDFDTVGTVHTFYRPTSINAVTYSDHTNTITWDNSTDALSYSVYRKALGENDWTMIADRITSGSYTDEDIAENAVYAYALRILDEDGNVVVDGCGNGQYYQNGAPANGTFSANGIDYRLDEGIPANGYYYDHDVACYYQNGIRFEQDWFKQGAYQAPYNRAEWLYELMSALGEAPDVDRDDAKAIFDAAVQRGIVDSYTDQDDTLSVDRRYVANTIYNALGYSKHTVGTISDIETDDIALSTLAYYGYFTLDDDDHIYPTSTVTEDEFDALLSQIRLYRQLKGKTVLSFGDSIMHGAGNHSIPISHLMAEKYGMTAYDYSVNGATMGIYSGKSHIPDQVRKTAEYHHQPDLILINGGTNDMFRDVELGDIQSGFDMSKKTEDTYSGGFEKALWLIRSMWQDVPVIFIRVHNTNLSSDSNERIFGERGLEVADKWHCGSADIYNDTSMNGEDQEMADRYTYPNPDHNYKHDSIHPNALGYATFYIPMIEQVMAMAVND